MADVAEILANRATAVSPNDAKEALRLFDVAFSWMYDGPPIDSISHAWEARPGTGRHINAVQGLYIGGQGFQTRYQDSAPVLLPPDQDVNGPTADQTHHFSAFLSMGINQRMFMNWYGYAREDIAGDKRLGEAAYEIGAKLRGMARRSNMNGLKILGEYIRQNTCDKAGRGLNPGEFDRLDP